MAKRILWVLLAGVLLTPAALAQKKEFIFTAIPDQDETRLQERYSRTAEYLAAQLGVPVRYVPVKSYPAAVTAFQNNQVQMAWFGGFTGVQARRLVPGSEAIVQGEEDAHYTTLFIANSATGIKRGDALPDAIVGHTFTFGAKTSTSGRLMPEYYLRERFNKAPEEIFSRVGFSGDHSRTIQLVASGAYEIGAVDVIVFNTEKKLGKFDPTAITVIWETPTFPDYQYTVRGDLDREFGNGFKERLRKVLVGITDPTLLEAYPRTRLIPADNQEYAPLDAVIDKLGLLQ